ncbi:aromatase/cyclase [Actinoplanes awajinensis]|uniref:Aromatase n=1 Tax=Actinoplanes awajinensis subsp. mycoplanecinus TaxID=135947 RepID=A0A0X3V5N9_9ACTN|nr:aromatase/cyclase [Actinoplanes awajinensis]KUL39532.1 aromatase [Actinoplanes awajinensis subsp. mycoplanecinus]
MTSATHVVEEKIPVRAPVQVCRDLVTDLAGWSQLHRPAVHAEHLAGDASGELVQRWYVTGPDSVRTWRERRTAEDDGRRVTFVHEPADPPFADLRGAWYLEEQPDGTTLVVLRHEFALLDPDPAELTRRAGLLRQDSLAELETLRYAAEHRDELAELIISFEDPLFVAGSVRDAYTYLYEADKWPERIPHVARLTMTEEVPGIQFFDMDTVSADGSEHTTRSVRICLPNRKIVYKQTQPPATMTAHAGHWMFTETPEGLILGARHTCTIRPDGLHLLGAGTTVAGARRYLRKVLSANSMGNLRLAKAYAEERAEA